MAPASIPGAHDWGNPYCLSLLSVLGPSPRYREGLGTPFLFGCRAARSASQAKLILTIEAYLHHTRAPPRVFHSVNPVHGNYPCKMG